MARFSSEIEWHENEDGTWSRISFVGEHLFNADRSKVLAFEPVGCTLKVQGRVASLHWDVHCPQAGGGKRGAVTGFSHQSRTRLIRKLATISADPTQFVTMTYPVEYDPSAKKRHLHAFASWMRRNYPQAAYFWKLEYQKRGAPHYHLILWYVPWSLDFALDISAAWYLIVGSGDDNHLQAGTRCEIPDDPTRWKFYLAKYIGKDYEIHDFDPHSGRIWGFHNKKLIPFEGIKIYRVHNNHDAVVRHLKGGSRILSESEFEEFAPFIEKDYWQIGGFDNG